MITAFRDALVEMNDNDGPISFLLLAAAEFHTAIRPALTAAWQQRCFQPCQDLCRRLLPRAREFARRYHLAEEPLLCRLPEGLSFHRHLWRYLAGEILWIAAADIPNFPTCPETFTCLLAPEWLTRHRGERRDLPPILQVHHGSADLWLGCCYRPEQAGWNDSPQVARLAEYLDHIDPAGWTAAMLEPLPGLPAEEREEELAFARDWLEPLRAVYRRAVEQGCVVVCERL